MSTTAAMKQLVNTHGVGVRHMLGIEYVKQTRDEVIAKMTVSSNHLQPMGLLHGGATAALAEEAMSLGAGLNAPGGIVGVGLSCNHCGSAREGDVVQITATPQHRGRRTQVWHATVTSGTRLISLCSLTLMNLHTDTDDSKKSKL